MGRAYVPDLQLWRLQIRPIIGISEHHPARNELLVLIVRLVHFVQAFVTDSVIAPITTAAVLVALFYDILAAW